MRWLLKIVALALCVAAHAQTYPTKTVRLISGVTPGSASDTMARILAEKLSVTLGQPVIVENRLGAGGLVGATAGVGSATHMALERFRYAAGFEVLNVHTKGAGEALTEVVSGRADCYFALVFQAQKMRDSGKVSALVVSSPKRTSLTPELPTTVEAGYPNSDYNFWLGALVPAKTPREIVERLHKEIDTLVKSPEISER